jgi:hypothetical protein
MNLDRRLGKQDVDAATLFAAARSFRPSARGRRRALRALGLPIGLSLFGSGLAHAAYLLSSSLKGWGLIAGVAATVGAAGGVTYVVTKAPSVAPSVAPSMRSRATAKATPSSGRATTAAAATTNLIGVPEGPSPSSSPAVDRPPLPRPVPGTVRRLAMRTAPRALPSSTPDDDGVAPRQPDPAPAVAVPVPVERPRERLEPPAFPAPAPAPAPPRAMTSASSSLNGELALVAEAQARLRVGDARGAFAALDLHARLYPTAALAEEVELLRLRAFIAKGDPHGARLTGETFLRRHPASPLGARFRSLMNELDARANP